MIRELVSLTILLVDFLGAVEDGSVDRAVIRCARFREQPFELEQIRKS